MYSLKVQSPTHPLNNAALLQKVLQSKAVDDLWGHEEEVGDVTVTGATQEDTDRAAERGRRVSSVPKYANENKNIWKWYEMMIWWTEY